MEQTQLRGLEEKDIPTVKGINVLGLCSDCDQDARLSFLITVCFKCHFQNETTDALTSGKGTLS